MIASLLLLPSLVSGLSDRKLQAVNSDSWFKNRECVVLRPFVYRFGCRDLTTFCVSTGHLRHNSCVRQQNSLYFVLVRGKAVCLPHKGSTPLGRKGRFGRFLAVCLSCCCMGSSFAQDCDWVAEFVPQRCTVVGYDKTLAWEACPEACPMMYDDDNETVVDVDEEIMRMYKGGQFNECPPETMYWEHDESVYGGYAGCVGENLYTPCEQDGFDTASFEEGTKFYTFDEATGTCIKTDRTLDNRTFWIIWGLPTDTNTLIEKTGLNPVIKFPLLRQTYPAYTWQGSEIADDSSAKPVMKSWLSYLGIFTPEQTEDFEIVMTEVRRNPKSPATFPLTPPSCRQPFFCIYVGRRFFIQEAPNCSSGGRGWYGDDDCCESPRTCEHHMQPQLL